jgi:uncharacterized protein YbaA (DUF1428 family)
MAEYVDGYVLPLPRKNLAKYRKIARMAARVWRKHGALAYRECVGDDLQHKRVVTFPKLARAEAGETVVFAYIVYRSKAHRNKVNAKVMKDPLMNSFDPKDMPFDVKKMAFGGFRVFAKA